MKSKVFLLIAIFLLNIACDDVLETDISEDTISLQLPSEGFSSTVNSITFRWDELKGARTYELYIVSPDHLNATSLALDTVIAKNQFTVDLSKGNYEWCVKGANAGYETEYICRKIEILN